MVNIKESIELLSFIMKIFTINLFYFFFLFFFIFFIFLVSFSIIYNLMIFGLQTFVSCINKSKRTCKIIQRTMPQYEYCFLKSFLVNQIFVCYNSISRFNGLILKTAQNIVDKINLRSKNISKIVSPCFGYLHLRVW